MSNGLDSPNMSTPLHMQQYVKRDGPNEHVNGRRSCDSVGALTNVAKGRRRCKRVPEQGRAIVC
jgi:hypothetical protein